MGRRIEGNFQTKTLNPCKQLRRDDDLSDAVVARLQAPDDPRYLV
jgi:hypothetical protein